MSALTNWSNALSNWGIPPEILKQAPTSPWIHPPTLFEIPAVINDSPSHSKAREVLPESVLDIGCGGGIAAFALGDPVKHVIGVDHQQEMLEMFANNADNRGLTHEEYFGDWPDIEAAVPLADVVVCHHVMYNVSDVKSFVDALNAHAHKRVVIEIPQTHPLTMSSLAWKHFWDLDRPTTPTSDDLVRAIKELNIDVKFHHWQSSNVRTLSLEDEIRFTRIRLCLDPSRDEDIRNFLSSQNPPEFRNVTTLWWDVN